MQPSLADLQRALAARIVADEGADLDARAIRSRSRGSIGGLRPGVSRAHSRGLARNLSRGGTHPGRRVLCGSRRPLCEGRTG